jgi:hypothetical protein
MEASVMDLRHKMKEILKALDQNEPVKILYHGKQRGLLIPSKAALPKSTKAHQHPSFGMWNDDPEKQDVTAYVRKLRKARYHAL